MLVGSRKAKNNRRVKLVEKGKTIFAFMLLACIGQP